MDASEILCLCVLGSPVAFLVGFFIYDELNDRNSLLRSWLWCRKHGLKLKSQVCGYGGGVEYWWGEDADGNQYVPGKGADPKLIR